VDGAGHSVRFLRIAVPMTLPAIASLTIFVFLGVWNDLLVALTFLGTSPFRPLTVVITGLVTSFGGGWQFLTRKEFHKTVAQLNGEKFLKRLSAASLETLAIIAYKQPITKGEIESIRGVSCDYTVQKLLEKELVIISGRNEKQPGQPLIYSTSKNFMDYFGINSADELPKIREVMTDQGIEPTILKDTLFGKGAGEGQDDDEVLAVTEEGELIKKENNEDGEE